MRRAAIPVVLVAVLALGACTGGRDAGNEPRADVSAFLSDVRELDLGGIAFPMAVGPDGAVLAMVVHPDPVDPDARERMEVVLVEPTGDAHVLDVLDEDAVPNFDGAVSEDLVVWRTERVEFYDRHTGARASHPTGLPATDDSVFAALVPTHLVIAGDSAVWSEFSVDDESRAVSTVRAVAMDGTASELASSGVFTYSVATDVCSARNGAARVVVAARGALGAPDSNSFRLISVDADRGVLTEDSDATFEYLAAAGHEYGAAAACGGRAYAIESDYSVEPEEAHVVAFDGSRDSPIRIAELDPGQQAVEAFVNHEYFAGHAAEGTIIYDFTTTEQHVIPGEGLQCSLRAFADGYVVWQEAIDSEPIADESDPSAINWEGLGWDAFACRTFVGRMDLG